MIIEYIIIGIIVGGLVGMTGVGGASILTPILILMGVQPTIAIGTDFIYNSITKAFGAAQHMRQKTVNFKLVKNLAIGSIPSAVLANILFYSFFSNYYNEDFVMYLLGIVLFSISIITLVQMAFKRLSFVVRQGKVIENKEQITILGGVIIGAIVGITSIGAGSFFALFILYIYKIDSSELVGTDITHAFLLTLVLGLLMARLGNVDYLIVSNLLCGSIPSAVFGSMLTKKIPSEYIRFLIVVIILISGISLVLKASSL